MDHNLKGSRIKVRVRENCSIGYVERSISRGISHRIKVVGLISTVYMKHKQLW